MATLLFVTDIWGQHASLDPLLSRLEAQFDQVEVLDPYSGQRFAFEDEAQAYEYFQRRCTARIYQQKLAERLSQGSEPLLLLAFSAGANAAWPLLSQPELASRVTRASLCYGNQILAQPTLTPQSPTQLLLCRDDAGVLEHQAPLARACQVELSEAGHGFINPRSPHFDANAADTALADAVQWLQQR
ncbi:dienelactone hydrolase family protein [Ferrimonas marina]|uniref:Dienelactone hydrolase n=1 Tax=Ferrimonas marina TaxID=299255 RepID=A0A1M5XB87_9GAMM|nr:dienelactone hydrolase family protein [Ferrimonas marina]SHH96828.1 Dienelactone hydrolase [Ferrimonas marina]